MVPSKQVGDRDNALTLRPGIEEETTLLNKTVAFVDAAADGIITGAMKPTEANSLLTAGRLLSAVAKQSIADRQVRGRLIAQEAKTIEGRPTF